MKENKFNFWFNIIIWVCCIINIFVFFNSSKGWYADYKCPYEDVWKTDTIWKDVKKNLTISGKTVNGVRAEYFVVMENSFYTKSHKEQLAFSDSVNKAVKSYFKQHGAYILTPEETFKEVAYGWKIMQFDRYNDLIAYNILEHFSDINNVHVTYKYWTKKNKTASYTYGYTPDSLFIYMEKNDSINAKFRDAIHSYERNRENK